MTLRAVCAVLMTGSVFALSANLRAEPPADAIPTPIEQALIERSCAMPSAVALGADKHDACLQEKLSALRGDFGYDLGRLNAAERKKMDSACGQIREHRDVYVDCLATQMVAIRSRWSPARLASAGAPAAAEEPLTEQPAAAPAENTARTSSTVAIASTVVTALAAAVAVPLIVRKRRARRVCQICGERLGQAGDMCAGCRREAAETLRRAAADRQAAQERQEREQREREDGERARVARAAEEQMLQEQELARQHDEAVRRQEEERRKQAEFAEQQRRAASKTDDGFDPYAILGVSRDASEDAIRAAHEEAKSKYNFEQVEDLGFEIKQHYLNKAEAVNRAFRMLTTARRDPALVSHDATLNRENRAQP